MAEKSPEADLLSTPGPSELVPAAGLEPATLGLRIRDPGASKGLPGKEVAKDGQGGCARQRAHSMQETPEPAALADPALRALVDSWTHLPEHVKQAVSRAARGGAEADSGQAT